MRRHCLRICEAHHKPNSLIETSAHYAHTLKRLLFPFGSSIVEVVISQM